MLLLSVTVSVTRDFPIRIALVTRYDTSRDSVLFKNEYSATRGFATKLSLWLEIELLSQRVFYAYGVG